MRRMKRIASMFLLTAAMCSMMAAGAQAADYSFQTDGTPEYYGSTSYEEVYGSQYNYGGTNIVDYQIPALEYGSFSTTQTGVMEKALLPGLQQSVYTATASGGGYGVTDNITIGGTAAALPDVSGVSGISGVTGSTLLSGVVQFTNLDDISLLSNGAIGKISIPAINIKNFYLWEGETTASMKKGLGHFSSTSVWNGNVAACGHNRGATYVIGAIKDLEIGDTITYTTSLGTRTYAVQTVTKISSSDWNYLSATTDNRITLITCVAGDSSQRWVVQGIEIS